MELRLLIQRHNTKRNHSETLEVAICLEMVMQTCYESLQQLISNGHVRQQCESFCEEIIETQYQLRQLLENPTRSDQSIEHMYAKYKVDPLCFSPIGIITTALHRANKKETIYLSLARRCDPVHRYIFEHCAKRTAREIKFLQNEQAFQQNKMKKVEVVYAQWVVELPEIQC